MPLPRRISSLALLIVFLAMGLAIFVLSMENRRHVVEMQRSRAEVMLLRSELARATRIASSMRAAPAPVTQPTQSPASNH